LLGCFIEMLVIDNKYFGIEISHDYQDYKSAKIYAQDFDTINTWKRLLKQASNSVTVHEDYEIKEVIGVGKFSNVHRAFSLKDGT
jgi:hypothetical protein